jgi:uroporphyrin-III C-methyltransferase / precorrin-2 dehydrogenase / sirohydrochlorin ferrochelatase
MATFPLFADVRRMAPLVNGSGDLAVAKVRSLLIRVPRVVLAAAALPEMLLREVARIDLLKRRPEEADIKGRSLVISATGDEAEDARVSALARALGVPVSVPDKPELCTFAPGACFERGDVTIAMRTDGAAPILATHRRGCIERELHPRLGQVAAIARKYGLAGRVSLVGAGPGDPDLLTLKAVRALKAADVILYDSLVGDGVLDHARREATLIDVGKRGGRPSTKQADIHALMITHARAGRAVVRLKGGDAFVFGRAAEEIAAIEAAGITVDIVPGITAAQACAVDARLPLTYRGEVRQFSVVSGTSCDGDPDLDWDALARPGQAFAIYMGVGTAAVIVRRLVDAGATSVTKAIIVENGGRREQRIVATTLGDLDAAIEARGIRGPAILFVGLDWAAAGLKAPAHVDHYCRELVRLRDGGMPALRPAQLEQFALSQ